MEEEKNPAVSESEESNITSKEETEEIISGVFKQE